MYDAKWRGRLTRCSKAHWPVSLLAPTAILHWRWGWATGQSCRCWSYYAIHLRWECSDWRRHSPAPFAVRPWQCAAISCVCSSPPVWPDIGWAPARGWPKRIYFGRIAIMQNVWLQIWLCWSLSTHPCCSLQSSSRAPAVVILSRSRCKCCIWSLASDADGGGVHVDVVVSADATRDCTSSSVFWNWRIFCNKERKWFELVMVMHDLIEMENCLLPIDE